MHMEGVQDQLKPVSEDTRRELLEPIGDVVIGKVDPRTLSRVEFERSSELLFHGAESDFAFQRKIISGPNSQTIGDGFYTTDDKKNAEFYSNIRKSFKGEPVILSLLPYKAKMLDFRTKDNPTINAPVSPDFIIEYRDFIISIIKSQFPNGQPDFKTDYQKAYYFQNLSNYRSTLNKLIFGGKPIELRQILSLEGNATNSEFGASFFTDFMLKKGYDGVISNEGGDHPDQRHTTSYVFYNLEKLGTYDVWHTDELKTVGKVE